MLHILQVPTYFFISIKKFYAEFNFNLQHGSTKHIYNS